jgi:hypothetical protein
MLCSAETKISYVVLVSLALLGACFAQDIHIGSNPPVDTCDCSWQFKSYPVLEIGLDSAGNEAVVRIEEKADTTSRFSSQRLKHRVLLAGRNAPESGDDFAHILFERPSSKIVLLSEHSFTDVPEVHFLEYYVGEWYGPRGAFHDTEIIVAYNDSLDQIYLLTHPNLMTAMFTSDNYPQKVMRGNFNAMLSDCSELRDRHRICAAGLFAALQRWHPGYPAILVSTPDELVNAIRLSRLFYEQPHTFNNYLADNAVVFFPAGEIPDVGGEVVPDLSAAEKSELTQLADTAGIDLPVDIATLDPNYVVPITACVVSTFRNQLYRIRVSYDIASQIDGYSYEAKVSLDLNGSE